MTFETAVWRGPEYFKYNGCESYPYQQIWYLEASLPNSLSSCVSVASGLLVIAQSPGCLDHQTVSDQSYLADILFRELKHRSFSPYRGTVPGLLVAVIFIIDGICKDPKSFKNIQSSSTQIYTFGSTFCSGSSISSLCLVLCWFCFFFSRTNAL